MDNPAVHNPAADNPAANNPAADNPARDSAASRAAGAPEHGAPEDVFAWLDDEATDRAERGLVRRLRHRPAEASELDLAGNDYLGLAGDKRVTSAAAAAALRWGAGATGSRLVTGSIELHAELERELARFCGTEAALVFSSGFAANLGAITALAGKESALVTDRHIHASLIDGCRLSRAEVAAVAHSDPAAIAHALGTRRRERALVVTDAVFSVDGDLAPLAGIAEAARAHGAGLLVDDAHGIGVLGTGGRGAVHEAGLAACPDVVTTITLSKALGAQGGAVLGPRRVIRHLIDTARSFIFDTALAPASAGAALAALGILAGEPDRAARVREVAAGLAARLRAAGLAASEPDAAVVSVRAPSAEEAVAWAARCAEQGIRVGCFRPPSVPDGVSRLRLTARADLSEQTLDHCARIITDSAPRLVAS